MWEQHQVLVDAILKNKKLAALMVSLKENGPASLIYTSTKIRPLLAK